MNQIQLTITLVPKIQKYLAIHNFLYDIKHRIIEEITTINAVPEKTAIMSERLRELRYNLEYINTDIESYEEQAVDSMNDLNKLRFGSDAAAALEFTTDDFEMIESQLNYYILARFRRLDAFEIDIEDYKNYYNEKLGYIQLNQPEVPVISFDLNINSNYNDEEEPQANSNNTFDQTLLPGHDYIEQVKEIIPIAVHNEPIIEAIFSMVEIMGKENELLDLKEDADHVYKAIEEVIPFHEERIVTRSLTKKLGENGIKLFELENHYENHLGKKRKELKGLKK